MISFLRSKVSFILYFLLSQAAYLLIWYLTAHNMGYGWYMALLCTTAFAACMAADYMRAMSRCKKIREAKNGDILPRCLPEPASPAETEYRALTSELCAQLSHQREENSASKNRLIEYYTQWIHQIKTPIFALRLLLDSPQPDAAQLTRELFDIERYADMALQYSRLTEIGGDVLLAPCDLKKLVNECVKKYSTLFIAKKLRLKLDVASVSVTTDQKWLAFIIEQLLSNAIKYSGSGVISLTGNARGLTIADQGVGIAASDLPRIFDKGYTGANGRLNKRASGLGMYMAKKAADAIELGIHVTSKQGAGTTVRLAFPDTGVIIE